MPRSVTFTRVRGTTVEVTCGPYVYRVPNVQRLSNAMRKAGIEIIDVLAVAVGMADRSEVIITIPSEQWVTLSTLMDLVP